MNCGMLAVEVDEPVTVMLLMPITPRNVAGTLAEKLTTVVTALPVLFTVADMLLSV